jgi:hypothetical protein
MQHATGTGKKTAWRIFIENTEGKRPLERSERRWEGNNQMDLKERKRMGWYGLNICGKV